MAVLPDGEGSSSTPRRELLPQPLSGQLGRALGPLQVVSGIVLFGLVVLALARSWDDVRDELARIAPHEIALAQAFVLAGLGASVLTWRAALRELGPTIGVAVSAKIYLLGQLGKYLPGSFWALALQMELASRARVSRGTGMAASVLAIAVNVVTGLALGLLVLPSVLGGGPARVAAIVAVVVAAGVALTPPVLTRLLAFVLSITRRAQAARRIGWAGILAATGWSLTSWASYGASVWILAIAVGAPAGRSLVFCVGGIALAMTAGFLVVVAPSGIGVREAAIVASLAPVLDRSEALAVALVARLLFTIADLLAAAIVVPVRIHPVGGD